MELWKLILPSLFLCGAVCPGQALKSNCEIVLGVADCSHMNLNSIPQDLPDNITTLDVSHNRLTQLKASSLERYRRLERLDASYNSLTTVPGSLCLVLPELRVLSTRHNEVHLLQESDLHNCTQLTHMDLSDNRLRLTVDPFLGVQNLVFLDVSRNKLTSARLGSQPQLQSLVTLVLDGNAIDCLKKDDFSFLSSSSSFKTLGLSSLPLKKLETGCFRPISGLQELVLDGCNLNPTFLSKLCDELSDTSVRNLSLRNTQQVTIINTTFKGLAKTNLTILDLTKNKIAHMNDGSFQWLPVLELLSLEQNNIKRLTNGTFAGLRSLRELNLRAALPKTHTSSHPSIDDFSFQELGALEYLWLDHNSFWEVTEKMFYGLRSLRVLNLSWSSTGMRTIVNTTFSSLSGSPNLHTLNMSGMGITRLGPGAFSSLENLTCLVLSYNSISQQLSGDEFWGLKNVREIRLSSNQQKIKLTPTSFVNVPTLRILTLDRALTATLDMEPSPFSVLVNLTVLDLSNNNIANIQPSLVDGLGRLSVLKLQHNNLARFWKNANPGGPVLFLRDVRNLAVLELDYNGLDEIPVGALRGLSQLRELSLSSNLLNFLHDSIFDDLQSLRVLRLEKNFLTTVRPETFKVPLSNLSELRMDRNPFDCTCESILWFSTWLNATEARVPGLSESYVCNTPSAYFNHSVKLFDPQSCKDMTPFQALYILNSTLVLGLMAIAFLVRFQGWRIQFYWNIMINRTLGMRDSGYQSLDEDQYEYSAYVVHAEEDSLWVERSLCPLEKYNLRFFLENRDAMPGHSTLDSIVENMRRSRKILFVVTEALLNDPWCRQFKVHYALHQLMEDSRDSLVLVFLEDVTDHHLCQSLRLRKGMIKRHCLLYWPLQKERIPAFRQKLKLALASSNTVNQEQQVD